MEEVAGGLLRLTEGRVLTRILLVQNRLEPQLTEIISSSAVDAPVLSQDQSMS